MQVPNSSMFWQAKRVFITGHTGFKGGWLSHWLSAMGADVTGFSADPPSTPNLFEAAGVDSVATSITGDIRNLESLHAAMQKAQPDIVFHLAAQSLVRQSYQTPVETFDTNVMGTVNVLEAIRMVESVKAAVVVTSDKCYENRESQHAYQESDAMGGYDTYSASKGCAELVAQSYVRSFFSDVTKRECAIATARAGNVIGGGDWAANRLVPDILQCLGRDQAVEIRSPNAIRPWQHVLEPLSGYMVLAQRLFEDGLRFSGGWNFGPNDDGVKTVSWVVEELVKQWGSGDWFLSDAQHPHEATLLMLDSTKAEVELGWVPVWTPSDALKATVRWHKCWLEGSDMAAETLADIELFVNSRKAMANA